ncbi:MAG TPA: hypothetical protein V6C57_02815 [Coleofasciculaceae cyanobacterium]
MDCPVCCSEDVDVVDGHGHCNECDRDWDEIARQESLEELTSSNQDES